jgi:hypothetical protein
MADGKLSFARQNLTCSQQDLKLEGPRDGEGGARWQPDAAYDRTLAQYRDFPISRLTPGMTLGNLGQNRWEMRAPTTNSPLPAES